MRPVDKDDHIRGSTNAQVKLVEFADFECPFCKKLHMTMKELMKEYETEGKVAWVYRHAFSDQLHKKARQEAEASECANELRGNDGFWKYTDRIFEITPSDDRLDLSLLPQIAKEIGFDESEFNSCLVSRRHQQRVAQDLSDAMTAGASGTPYVVIVGPNNKRYDFSGAQTKEFVKNLINLALSEK
jgi:protein-disulfide isomerase